MSLASPFLRFGWWLLLAALPCSLLAEQPFSFASTPGQLPKSIVPRNYTLRIQPDLPQRTFRGTARITIEVLEPVTEVVLNALELEIDAVTLITQGEAVQTLNARLDPTTETLALSVDLGVGTHTLEIAYRGLLNRQAQGFFVDEYTTPDGPRLMLGTQMEPTDARRAFPCWDEPVFRATYDVTLVIPKELMGVANTPIVREEPTGTEHKAVTFARTPAMPSYLVAIYAAEFESVEDDYEGIKLRILTTQGKRDSGLYAMEVTKQVLAYFHDYFGTPYPLAKLDQIGVPNAFSGFGAMENWGCITYIDTALLYDPATSSQSRKEVVFSVVAHEIAHQWFGNIVTMAWWDNLWLNEGFASWLETKTTDALNPDWKYWLRANASKEEAMALDVRSSSHPILQPIANEAQAANAFDDISYLKGQSFLRMLEAYLGEKEFRDGIRRYLRQHAYSNTTTADLWAALESSSGQPVGAIAADWTGRAGFPVITVSSQHQDGHRQLVLEQTRFTLGTTDSAAPPWNIPVTFATLERFAQPTSLLMETSQITVPWPAGSGPIKLNVGNTGFYRVHYDDDLGDALTERIAEFPADDQLNLLSDTWALALAGRVPSTRFLELANQLIASPEPAILTEIITTLGSIDELQQNQPGRRAFQRWARNFLSPLSERLTWEAQPGESPLETSLRADVIGMLGILGDNQTIVDANQRFQAYLKDPASLSGDLIGPVMILAGRYADRATYDQLRALARRALTTEGKARAYRGLQSALDPDLLADTLLMSLGDEMPVSEANQNLTALADHSENPAAVARYTMDNFAALIEHLGNFEIYGYLPGIMKTLSDADQADALMAFTAQSLPADALPIAARTAEGIRDRAAFKQRALSIIDAWVITHLAQTLDKDIPASTPWLLP